MGWDWGGVRVGARGSRFLKRGRDGTAVKRERETETRAHAATETETEVRVLCRCGGCCALDAAAPFNNKQHMVTEWPVGVYPRRR